MSTIASTSMSGGQRTSGVEEPEWADHRVGDAG
jgi:hypothetical protein